MNRRDFLVGATATAGSLGLPTHKPVQPAERKRPNLVYVFADQLRYSICGCWPGKVRAHSTTEALLGTPDIMPTLLSLMGLPTPHTVEGKDLSGAALGTTKADNEAAHMQGLGATAAWVDGTEWRALRDHEYTYAIYHRDRKELLFHNRRDPYQMKDLAGDRAHRATLQHYCSLSERWRKEQNDTFEACSWYEPRWTQNRNITNTARGVGQNLDHLQEVLAQWLPDSVGDRSVGVPVGV